MRAQLDGGNPEDGPPRRVVRMDAREHTRERGEMMIRGKLVVAALGATLLFAAPAEAQLRTVMFGAGGGVSIPVGDFGKGFDTGFHLQGSMAFAPVMLPFGVRADLFYQRVTESGPGHDDHALTHLAGILNAIFPLGGFGVRPYASAGVGVYNARGEHDVESTDLGLNGGLGVQFGLGGLNAFLEGKFHHVMTSGTATQFVPITIGIMF
jgi:hypothetical protein